VNSGFLWERFQSRSFDRSGSKRKNRSHHTDDCRRRGASALAMAEDCSLISIRNLASQFSLSAQQTSIAAGELS
jgi:hypothetical protein